MARGCVGKQRRSKQREPENSSSRVSLEFKREQSSCFTQFPPSEEPLESEAVPTGTKTEREDIKLTEPCSPSRFSSSLFHMCCCPRDVSTKL